MEVHLLSRFRFLHTLGWALLISVGIVAVAAGAGRAVINMKAALIDKPDIAIYLLLPEEKFGKTTLLREKENERDYLAETPEGPKLVTLKRGDVEWFVSNMELLRE